MSDYSGRFGRSSNSPDLGLRSEPFEITPSLVAANMSFGGSQVLELPGEMISAVERIWRDENFVWPTTIAVTRISMSVEPQPGAEPPEAAWSRVSVLGTGWQPGRVVALSWQNAFGFSGDRIALPDVMPDSTGFFGTDIVMRTTRRRGSDFVWDLNNQLVLVADQSGVSGAQPRRADQRGLPPHVVWQWTR